MEMVTHDSSTDVEMTNNKEFVSREEEIRPNHEI